MFELTLEQLFAIIRQPTVTYDTGINWFYAGDEHSVLSISRTKDRFEFTHAINVSMYPLKRDEVILSMSTFIKVMLVMLVREELGLNKTLSPNEVIHEDLKSYLLNN